MSLCEGTNMKFLRNKTYWQSTPDNIVPKVEEVDYPAYLSNDSANQVLHDGGAQWGGQFMPSGIFITPPTPPPPGRFKTS